MTEHEPEVLAEQAARVLFRLIQETPTPIDEVWEGVLVTPSDLAIALLHAREVPALVKLFGGKESR